MPDQITTAQRSAIIHHKGACLVLAGPGSGKTFVITNRVAHMVREHHIPGEHILVITFTKAAAVEMEERFVRLLPDEHPWFGTFHSCFYHILKNSYTSIPGKFISTEEKYHILHTICQQILDKDCDIELEETERLLSLYMNNGLSVKGLPEYADLNSEHLRQMYRSYHIALQEYGLMDFDDMMLCTYQLLKDNPKVRQYWQQQFPYILIDECQDMNLLQYEIIRLLTGPERNVFMVGDDDQSVYRFRGAKVELMQRFIEEYKPVRKLQLDTNFRSTKGIVDSSQKVIGQNRNRFVKDIRAYNAETSGLNIKGFELRKDMFEYIFEGLQKAPVSTLSSYAIICRTNQELLNMAYKMRQRGIPYQSKEEGRSIFDEDWYLDIEAYMRLGLGSMDRRYIIRVANKPGRFIRREQLVNCTRLPEPLAQAVRHIGTMRPYLAVKYIWSGIGYGRWLENNLDRNVEMWDAVCEQYEELVGEIRDYASLEDWLKHVEEDRALQNSLRSKKNKNIRSEGVYLLSMHASKGLEFDTVILPDVNKGKMPRGSKLTLEEIEEERRLFYVAMTRARRNLQICYVRGMKDHRMQPSVFLEPLL